MRCGVPATRLLSHESTTAYLVAFGIAEMATRWAVARARQGRGEGARLAVRLVDHRPFPWPGLAICIPGDITKEKRDLLRHFHLFDRRSSKQRNLLERMFYGLEIVDASPLDATSSRQTLPLLSCSGGSD